MTEYAYGGHGDIGGGGATDIRLKEGDNLNFESLKSRIIVAAGAGASDTNDQGGNLIGFNSKGNNGKGGIQTSEVSDSESGTFGLGGGDQSRIKAGLNSNGGGGSEFLDCFS